MANIVQLYEGLPCPVCREYYDKGHSHRTGFLQVLPMDDQIIFEGAERTSHKCSVCQSLFVLKESQ